MQFRTQTLLVVVASLGIALALSSGLPIGERAALGTCVVGVWMGVGLLGGGVVRHRDEPRAPALRQCSTYGLLLFGGLLTSFAFSLAAVLLGLALRAQTNRLFPWTE